MTKLIIIFHLLSIYIVCVSLFPILNKGTVLAANTKAFIGLDSVTELAKMSDIPSIPDIPDVIDNLTSSSTTDALSANQGRILKSLIDSSGLQLLATYSEKDNYITFPSTSNGILILQSATAGRKLNYDTYGMLEVGLGSSTINTSYPGYEGDIMYGWACILRYKNNSAVLIGPDMNDSGKSLSFNTGSISDMVLVAETLLSMTP